MHRWLSVCGADSAFTAIARFMITSGRSSSRSADTAVAAPLLVGRKGHYRQCERRAPQAGLWPSSAAKARVPSCRCPRPAWSGGPTRLPTPVHL